MNFLAYKQSADYIKAKIGDFVPEALLILGSGLGYLGGEVQDATYVPYGEIPNFVSSTAPGHEGRFVFGKLAGRNVAVMQGRIHVYEGYTPEQVAFPVRVAKLLGAHSLIVTNAAGGINKAYRPGDLVLLNDYIKLPLQSALTGENVEQFGSRFNDMSYTFCKQYRDMAKANASKLGLTLHDGVYFYTTGPQYETPAEIRAFRTLGADVVGMSTVHEAIVANHAGMKILGISLVTNMAAGILDQPLSMDEVLEAAENAKAPFSKLILAFLEQM